MLGFEVYLSKVLQTQVSGQRSAEVVSNHDQYPDNLTTVEQNNN